MTSHVTTHVLDAASGRPASGLGIVLTAISGDAVLAETPGIVLDHGDTDDDGRLSLGPESLDPGGYSLTFLTGAYFAARAVETFYPFVTVNFMVGDDAGTHYHVPLLLSPFAYSTYRGS